MRRRGTSPGDTPHSGAWEIRTPESCSAESIRIP